MKDDKKIRLGFVLAVAGITIEEARDMLLDGVVQPATLPAIPVAQPSPKPKRVLSKAARKAISRAQKARWAKTRKSGTVLPMKKAA